MVDRIVVASAPRGRVEIRRGVGRRRRWSEADKGRIVADAPGAVVSEVARRHEMSPQHLFVWRKAARNGRLALPAEEATVFVPVMMLRRRRQLRRLRLRRQEGGSYARDERSRQLPRSTVGKPDLPEVIPVLILARFQSSGQQRHMRARKEPRMQLHENIDYGPIIGKKRTA